MGELLWIRTVVWKNTAARPARLALPHTPGRLQVPSHPPNAPGETFGLAMAIGAAHYPATAMAVDDSVALIWPTSAWPRLIERFPALAANTLQTVGARLQESHTRILEMSTQQVEQRVAHALL